MQNEHSMSQIAIIIPVYNTEKYISKCINSVLSQTYNDYEIICINDGSTDRSQQILDEFAQLYANIRIINEENHGQGYARNAGLNLVNSKYVMFLDSDDFLPKHALEYFMEVADKTQVDVVVSGSMFNQNTFNENQVNSSYKWKICNNPLRGLIKDKKIYSSSCNKLYKAEILKTIRFLEGIYFEDWVFVTEVFGKIKNFASINIPLYVYNQSNLSTVRSPFSIKKILSYIKGISYIDSIYKNRNNYVYAQCRNIIAVKMCVNKVYKNAKRNPELVSCLKQQLALLIQNRVIKIRKLYLITLIKLLKMKVISFAQLLGD